MGHVGGVLQLLTCMLMWVMWGWVLQLLTCMLMWVMWGGVTVTDLYVDVGHVGVLQLLTCMLMWVMWGWVVCSMQRPSLKSHRHISL